MNQSNQIAAPLVVEITMEGGVIQFVHCPPGVTVIVRDYDTDGDDEVDLSIDEQGDFYFETMYGEGA